MNDDPSCSTDECKPEQKIGTDAGEVMEEASEDATKNTNFEADAAAPSSGAGSLCVWVQCVLIVASIAVGKSFCYLWE
jgi:hypothetical protein